MLNIGVDIIHMDYIKERLENSPSFIKRVFTENENIYCNKKLNPIQHFAVRFAAKEAVMKALGTGWSEGVQWNQIEILSNKNGEPIIKLYGATKKIFFESKYDQISVSLSHDQNVAIAFVIFHSINAVSESGFSIDRTFDAKGRTMISPHIL